MKIHWETLRTYWQSNVLSFAEMKKYSNNKISWKCVEKILSTATAHVTIKTRINERLYMKNIDEINIIPEHNMIDVSDII